MENKTLKTTDGKNIKKNGRYYILIGGEKISGIFDGLNNRGMMRLRCATPIGKDIIFNFREESVDGIFTE